MTLATYNLLTDPGNSAYNVNADTDTDDGTVATLPTFPTYQVGLDLKVADGRRSILWVFSTAHGPIPRGSLITRCGLRIQANATETAPFNASVHCLQKDGRWNRTSDPGPRDPGPSLLRPVSDRIGHQPGAGPGRDGKPKCFREQLRFHP